MGKTIMTVDDSSCVRQMVSFVLNEGGYRVLEAEDGIDALSKLRDETVDMIITDLNMPNLDGLGLIRSIRQVPCLRSMPVILVTTESGEERKQQARDAGATGWIVKPFKPEQLLAVVRKVMG